MSHGINKKILSYKEYIEFKYKINELETSHEKLKAIIEKLEGKIRKMENMN